MLFVDRMRSSFVFVKFVSVKVFLFTGIKCWHDFPTGLLVPPGSHFVLFLLLLHIVDLVFFHV